MILKLQEGFITARKRSLGQGNIFIGMCQEFCSQGGCLPQCMLGCPPPGKQTPQKQTFPLEQTPSSADTHTPEQTPPGSRHPRSRHSPWKQTPPPHPRSQSQHPPEADTPLEADNPPRGRHIPPTKHAGRYAWEVSILLECNLVLEVRSGACARKTKQQWRYTKICLQVFQICSLH